MKILLINPPPRTASQPNVLVPPLGLAYLAAVLKKEKFKVEILDANALRLPWEQFHQLVRQKKPDVAGFTGMTPTIDTTFKAAKICRPYAKYQILGGPHASVFGKEVFQQTSDFDFVIKGEGEQALINLLRRLVSGKKPRRFILAPPIKDPNRLPFPARELLPNHLYRYELLPPPLTTIFTSRGCPYGCLFCDKGVFGRLYRARCPENVLEEIEQVIKKYHLRSIIFFDDLFTLDKERVIKICQGIIKKGLKFRWKAEARVDTVDQEMLKMMKKAGCEILAYGAESANQKSLDFLRKNITVGQIKKAIRLTKKAGIKTLGYFILGIPGESYKQAQKTIQFAQDLKCDFAQFSLLTPYPGSPLYQLAVKNGWLKTTSAKGPLDLEIKKAVLLSSQWDEEKLNKIIKEAHRRFYLRPGFILKQISLLKEPGQIPFLFKNAVRLVKWYL